MKRLLKAALLAAVSFLFSASLLIGQEERVDSAAIASIKDEGMNRSKVMETLSRIADIYGPRLTGSPAYRRAAEWAVGELAQTGFSNPHLEAWGPFGKGWTLKRYSAQVVSDQVFPLISYPKAWSPGTGGRVSAEVVYLDAGADSSLESYKGKLRGKFVLVSDPRDVKAHWTPEATRETDSSLLSYANADMPRPRQRRFEAGADAKLRAMTDYRKLELCRTERAACILTASRGDGGNLYVQQAVVPQHPDTPFARRISVWDPKAPGILPQVAVGAEHYNRLVRMLKAGVKAKIEMELDVSFSKEDSCVNVIAEIPGTDLPDEVVMIGGHFDSWHGGTGATDDGTGSAVCMEAMRILKALDLKPKRTIRMALWGGEEQGLLGSEAYVKRHFGSKESRAPESPVVFKPEADKFSVYFNNDNGTGKVRGVFMEGNEASRPIFRRWLKSFGDMGASTLSLSHTGGTDHTSFDDIGLPGFQFIQDDVEYETRTHHSVMDLYERAQEGDLKQASVLMAAFAYNAAMRDARFPRKPAPQVTSKAAR